MPSLPQILDQYFDVAFASPDGMKKLRELILSLAMQGKLVPQDPSDQPARELLKEIEAEKSRLVKDGKIKASKPLPEIKPDEIPYNLPKSWVWIRIRNMCHDWGQKTPDSFFTYIDVGSIDNKRGVISDDVQLLESVDAPSRARKIVCKGTVIYSTVRPYLLNIAIVDKDFSPEPIASTAFAILHPFCEVSNRFIYYYLRSPAFISYVESTMKGVAYPAINDGDFFQGLFPLPPIAEQRRIVAKIDELMARCDELEKLRQVHAQKQITVHTAALNQLLTAKDHSDFKTSWHFITQHFGKLYSVKANVSKLRESILELAVMGRLSTTEQTDERIDSLLERISIERKKRGMNLRELENFEIEYQIAINGISSNRVYLKASFFCGFITKGTTPEKNELLSDGDIPFLKVYNIINNKLDFDYKPTFINHDTHNKKLKRSIVYPNDVIMNIVGPPLRKVAIVTDQYAEWNINQALAIFRPLAGINSKYLYYILSATSVLESVLAEVKGTAGQDNLSLEQCRNLLIPIPSIAEQHRIVAKIDQLMNLCDELEKQIDIADRKKTNLLNSVMAKI